MRESIQEETITELALCPHSIKVLGYEFVTEPFYDLCSPPPSGKSNFSFVPVRLDERVAPYEAGSQSLFLLL